ncbi:MAG: ferrous iron transport protein A [Clostridiales bacterium]|nr:ferrous iron transport protein A [Clostridiales bacterium]
MSVFLSELKKGDKALIIKIDNNIPFKIKRRLLELGFVENTKICLHSISILGEVLLLELNGFLLSVRKNIAKHIQIKKVN